MEIKNIFFDTETTSINPGQIGQLSYIVEGRQGIELAVNHFFDVEEVDEGAYKAHGMTAENFRELSGGTKFADIYPYIAEMFSDKRLIGHNVAFDIKFLSSELWRCGVTLRPLERMCTMEAFKNVLKIPNKNPRYGPYKNPNLGEVVNYFNLDTDKILKYSSKIFGDDGGNIGFHDSRFDTTAMYVATCVYREKLHGGNLWTDIFVKQLQI